MNKCYALWSIDEIVDIIRTAKEEHRKYYIDYLRNSLSRITDLLNNIPYIKPVLEDIVVNLKEDLMFVTDILIKQKRNKEFIGALERIGSNVAEGETAMRPLLDFAYPVDNFTFLEYFLDKEIIRISRMNFRILSEDENEQKEAEFYDGMTDVMGFIICSIQLGKYNQEEIKNLKLAEMKDVLHVVLEKFYQEKKKGNIFNTGNREKEIFIDRFGEKILFYKQNWMTDMLACISEVEVYLNNKETVHLDRAFNLNTRAHHNILKYRFLMRRFNQAGKCRKDEINEHYLSIGCPFIKDQSVKEELDKTNKKSEIMGLLQFFNVLSREDIKKLSQKIKLKKYVKDDLIFTEGTGADEVYIIKSGDVLVYNNIKTFATLKKGDMLGEIGVISGNTRSLSAAVTSPVSEIYVITKEHFINMLEKYPSLGINLSKVLCRRIDMATKKLTAFMDNDYLYHKDKAELANMKKKIDIISVNPFFNVLSNEQLERISSRIRLKRYDKGAVLFNEGDMADDFYIIKSGRISLYYNTGHSAREFRTLDKGDILGEMAVISDNKRSLSASVVSDRAELYVISKDNFLYLLNHYPELNLNMAKILCDRINILTERMSGIMGKTVTPPMPVQTIK